MNFTLFLIVSCLSISIKFIQAADDCTPGSLDNLELIELLKKSNEGKKCLKEAREVFVKERNGTKFNFGSGYNDIPIQDYGSAADLRNVDVIKRMLKNFGDLITSVSVSFDKFTVEEGKSILKQIDRHSSTSLQTLNLEHFKGNELNELKNTFDNVESIGISVFHENHIRIRSDDEKLSKFFPNIETLKVDHTKPSNWKFIAGKFPKLTQVTVQLQEQPDVVDDSHVASLFKENPQIEKLHLFYTNLKLLKKISENLSTLKTLDIIKLSNNYSNYEGDAISISSVEDLKVTLNRDSEILQNVVFNGLHELNLCLDTETGNKWIEFITNQVNPQIKIFHLTLDNLQSADLLLVPEKLPHMEKAYIRCKTNLVASDIVKFIEKNSKSLNYVFVDSAMVESEQSKLKELLSDKWIVDCSTYFDLSRIRITSTTEPEPDVTATESETGGTSSLVMSHLVQVLAVTWIFALSKLF